MNQNCEDKFKNSEDSGKKMPWKMIVPGSKQNSVEGSAPGECCVPRGEEMVAMWL